jgi:hypothetical protein
VDCEASPALAIGATILKLWAKLLNAHEILIAVFVLKYILVIGSGGKSFALPRYTGLEPQSHQIFHIETPPGNG